MSTDWKERLLTERTELHGKITRLAFIVRNPKPLDVSETQYSLMQCQYSAMCCYSSVLDQRLNDASWTANAAVWKGEED